MKYWLQFISLESVCKMEEEKCGVQAIFPPIDHGKCCGNLECVHPGIPGGVGTCKRGK